ncbi:conjugal transfer protein TraF [Vibrio nereis]|uniref:Conjugal transfer protein TraF n=1 Tax=Vibrio nereis TaxID=693 RepID=A0A0M0HQM2_VIBNE|nr:conjugal transfer protein TraF [Vibrio nereis]KOO04354.1 conjugal transfer protein TraF [Vibrio nereis]
MTNSIKLLPLSFALFASTATAANYAIEARGDAMGGVGVVSANFLTAPFYNPALTAIYRRNDDLGMILPSIGLTYTDEDSFIDDIDKTVDLIDKVKTDPSQVSALEASLSDLRGDQLKVELGGVVAFALPNQFVAANLFGKAYTESFVNPVIPDTGDAATDASNSKIQAVSVGVTEVGMALAKYQTFMGQHIAFGVSPKLQRVYTYVYEASLSDYELKDLRENSTGETVLNADAGFVWFYGPLRAGISASNILGRDIKTKAMPSNPQQTFEYKLRPHYTVGFGLVADYATLSVDYDLNEEERYTGFADNTQMIRVGGEVDLLRQLKLRAGWKRNLAYDNLDDTVTAGIGLSPLNLFQLDIGASYTNKDSMGGYINFLTSY